jgi:hypothetical protein
VSSANKAQIKEQNKATQSKRKKGQNAVTKNRMELHGWTAPKKSDAIDDLDLHYHCHNAISELTNIMMHRPCLEDITRTR